jgi:hypothetical protein
VQIIEVCVCETIGQELDPNVTLPCEVPKLVPVNVRLIAPLVDALGGEMLVMFGLEKVSWNEAEVWLATVTITGTAGPWPAGTTHTICSLMWVVMGTQGTPPTVTVVEVDKFEEKDVPVTVSRFVPSVEICRGDIPVIVGALKLIWVEADEAWLVVSVTVWRSPSPGGRVKITRVSLQFRMGANTVEPMVVSVTVPGGELKLMPPSVTETLPFVSTFLGVMV